MIDDQTEPAPDPAHEDPLERRSSGWDIRNAPRNYIWLIIFQAGSALFSFAVVWLITRTMGGEGYGSIVAVIAASQIVQVFVNWTSISVIRFGVDEFVETSLISRTFWTRLAALLVNMALVLALTNFWFPHVADWLRLSPAAIWLVAAHFGMTALWLHVQMSLQGAKKLREQGLLQMVERALIFAGILGLAVTGKLSFTAAVMCYIAAPVFVTAAGLFMLRSLIFTSFAMDGALLKKMLLYSLPLLPYSLVGYFSGSYVDAVFISKFLSIEDLGIYSIATQINGLALQVPTLANTILLPLLVTLRAEGDLNRTSNYFRHVLPSGTLVWGLVCTLVGALGYFLIPAVFGSEFAGASLPLWILLTAAAVAIPTGIGYSAQANAASKTYIALIAASAAAAVNIAANFVLIPRYGMVGCALATLFAFAASVIVFSIFLRSSEKVPISWTFLAVLPSVAAVIVILGTGSPLSALTVCVAFSAIVAFFRKGSLREMMAFASKFYGSK